MVLYHERRWDLSEGGQRVLFCKHPVSDVSSVSVEILPGQAAHRMAGSAQVLIVHTWLYGFLIMLPVSVLYSF